MNTTSKEVCDNILNGSLKRESACSTKRRFLMNNKIDEAIVYAEGVEMYDAIVKSPPVCSVYDKQVDDLTLLEVVNLWDDNRRLFTKWHMVRYSVLMMGELSSVIKYKGRMFNPDSFLSSLEG